MSDKPTTPTDTDDVDSTGSDNEEIEMSDIEADADFLKDRDPEDYPGTLRITSASDSAHRQDALDRLNRWEAGEEVPHVVNFENPSDLRGLLTDRRVELLRSIILRQRGNPALPVSDERSDRSERRSKQDGEEARHSVARTTRLLPAEYPTFTFTPAGYSILLSHTTSYVWRVRSPP